MTNRKHATRKAAAILTAVLMSLVFFATTAFAEASYHIKLNEKKTIYLDYYGVGSVTNSTWSSSDGRIVKIIDSTRMSCTIMGVDNFYGTTATITCRYHYRVGGSVFNGSKSYKVTVPAEESSGSQTSAYSLTATPASVTLDLVGNTRQIITLTANGKLPLLWGVGCNNSTGSYARIQYGEHRERESIIYITGFKVGSETFCLNLYNNDSGKGKKLASLNIPVKVYCSHKFERGVITKEPTYSSEGIRTYTCSACGNEKTERIEPKEPESVSEPETAPEETEPEETIPEETEPEETKPESTQSPETEPVLPPAEDNSKQPVTQELKGNALDSYAELDELEISSEEAESEDEEEHSEDSWFEEEEDNSEDEWFEESDDSSCDEDDSDSDEEDEDDFEEDEEAEDEMDAKSDDSGSPERVRRERRTRRSEEKSYDLADATVSIRSKKIRYTGREKEPYVRVWLNGSLLKSRYYAVTYYNNVNVGTAVAVIEGTGDYYGTVRTEFTIQKGFQDISGRRKITKRAKDQDWSFQLDEQGEDGVILSYSCDDGRLNVSAEGLVSVPAGYTGTAKIKVTAPETENWEAKTKTVTVKIQ